MLLPFETSRDSAGSEGSHRARHRSAWWRWDVSDRVRNAWPEQAANGLLCSTTFTDAHGCSTRGVV